LMERRVPAPRRGRPRLRLARRRRALVRNLAHRWSL